MKKVVLILLILIIFSGCVKKQAIDKVLVPTLSVEQSNDLKSKIVKIANKKSWIMDQNINYINLNIPINISNTYYSEILDKSKDGGYDFTKYLGKSVVEASVNLKYNNGDVAGLGHFLIFENKIIGAYYITGNYICSLNEKEVFKKNINWQNIENIKKKGEYKELSFAKKENLIYWTKYNDKSYLFGYSDDKLKTFSISDNKLIINNEITLDGLYLTSMFLKDVDNDKKAELGLLVSTNENYKDINSKSKLLIYEYGDKLNQKYSLSFDMPMWSVDADGQDIIVTSEKSIQMYKAEDGELKKDYAYNKVGGIVKVDDIDNSGINKFILIDSLGKDIYVFQKNKDGLEEIWRSYNLKAEFSNKIQTGDLNSDGVKEIYVEDIKGNTKKVILMENGFVDQNDGIKQGHKYFVGDFNIDGKYEYFDIFKNKKSEKEKFIYKY